MIMLDNPYLFSQVGLDSGALTQLGVVAHPFAAAGHYSGTVLLNGDAASAFTLRVDASSANSQVNIDLAAVGQGSGSCCASDTPTFSLHPTGYAVFHVGSGAGGFAVTLGLPGQASVFDSRALQAGDFFSATLLRPGTYVAHGTGAADSSIAVAYPSGRGRVAYKPPAPLRVVVGSGRLQTEVLRLQPAQSIVFEIKQKEARLVIELVTPDDGPANTTTPKTRPDAG